mmetsp:Transcript_25289/g.51586  ORF Transcript_25289/g.51586 Transcript_25289/m.51586 type:complete len:268 (-) Transcript_25289:220-1023(-)
MLIRPSIAVYDDILSKANAGEITSYDGGDTGLLNAYYSDWFASMPSSARLPFGYNAQRFMYNCTFSKRPQYWNEGVAGDDDGKAGKGGLYVIHYSSTPKPWEELERRTNGSRDAAKGFLDAASAGAVSKTAATELDTLWEEQYRKAQIYYYENDMKNAVNRRRIEEAQRRRARDEKKNEQLLLAKRRAEDMARAQCDAAAPAVVAADTDDRNGMHSVHKTVSKRYKELRREGMNPADAMRKARSEAGLDKCYSASAASQVGRMFGLM